MDARFLPDTPQIHYHVLSDDATAYRLGFAVMEMCCHGCGQAIYVQYVLPPKEEVARHNTKCKTPMLRIANLRNGFQDKHKDCPDYGYAERCPTKRTKTNTIDLTKVNLNEV